MLTSQSRAPLFLLNLWVVWKVNVCEANQPLQLVTLFVMEPTNWCDCYMTITLVPCFICKFNLPVLAEIEGCICFVSYRTWAEIPFHYRNYLEPRHTPFLSTSMDNRLDFMVATFHLYFKSVLIDRLGTRFPTRPPVSIFWTAHLHSDSLTIEFSCKLPTLVLIWAALSGTKGGKNSQVWELLSSGLLHSE